MAMLRAKDTMKQIRLYQNTQFKINSKCLLDDYASHHLTKVLRFPQGQNIVLFNGDGINYTAKVLEVKKNARVKILSVVQNSSESKLNLTLVQGIVKGEKMDFLIQKAVELGVCKIVPVFTEHCVVRLNTDKSRKRTAHWQKIIIGASEQSGRSIMPEILHPLNLNEWLTQPIKNGFVLHHQAKQTLLQTKSYRNAHILIGPEGGLSTAEIAHANQAGYQSLLLGKRILRTETASLTAIANMQLLWGS